MDHRLHVGTGTDRCLGRRSACRRLFQPGAAGDGAARRRRLAPVQAFPFSSGSSHAQWAIIGARCPDAGENIATRYLLVPRHEIEIIDDWHVLGLRATGSRTLLLRDVFVAEHCTVALRDLYDGTTPGARVHPDYDLLCAPRGFLVPFSLAPVGFSPGRRALAVTAETLRTRLSRGMRRMADSEVVQLQLGEAGAAIEVGTLVLHARREESMAILRSGRAILDDDILRNRRDITFALHEVRRGVGAWSRSPVPGRCTAPIRCRCWRATCRRS
jgi:3-hydroxy-9,10-secoandrosta-1,3,5(10)-triene-9,17-dione monooxygenase